MNDYGVPSQPSEFDDRGPWYYQARQRVQSAGTAMQWFGMISLFLAVLYLVLYAVAPDTMLRGWYEQKMEWRKGAPPGQPPLPPYEEYRRTYQMWGIVIAAVHLACSAMIFLGGSQMRQLEGYGMALCASILTIIPCTQSCCCFGSPIGVWALMVLLNADVKLAFSRNTPLPPEAEPI